MAYIVKAEDQQYFASTLTQANLILKALVTRDVKAFIVFEEAEAS